jgi:enamine deaminase RidA (YjgF/YER057c/UK114 family)
MPVITLKNPEGVHAPGARYSHAALVEGARRRLVISGQVGVTPDGTIVEGGPAQIAQALTNLRLILEAHGMSASDIVKMTVFLTDRELMAPLRAAREAFLGTHVPASTLLFVAGLYDPRVVVEIEAEAAA